MFWTFVCAMLVVVAIGTVCNMSGRRCVTYACLIASGIIAGAAAMSILPSWGIAFAVFSCIITIAAGWASLRYE